MDFSVTKLWCHHLQLHSESYEISQDYKFLEGDVRKHLFPAEIEPGQIIEIVKQLEKPDSGFKLTDLKRVLHVNADKLIRLINATQILAFTKIHDGRVWLGKRGLELNKMPDHEKKKIFKERLSLVEPFRTALEIARKDRENLFSNKVSSLLYKKDLRWADDEELNELLVHEILLDWSVFTGLFMYDGKTDRFILS